MKKFITYKNWKWYIGRALIALGFVEFGYFLGLHSLTVLRMFIFAFVIILGTNLEGLKEVK